MIGASFRSANGFASVNFENGGGLCARAVRQASTSTLKSVLSRMPQCSARNTRLALKGVRQLGILREIVTQTG